MKRIYTKRREIKRMEKLAIMGGDGAVILGMSDDLLLQMVRYERQLIENVLGRPI